jgi:hypothetical protein
MFRRTQSLLLDSSLRGNDDVWGNDDTEAASTGIRIHAHAQKQKNRTSCGLRQPRTPESSYPLPLNT